MGSNPGALRKPSMPHSKAWVLFGDGELAGAAGDPRLRLCIEELKEEDKSRLALSPARSPFASLELSLTKPSRPAGTMIESERGRMCGVLATSSGLDASGTHEAVRAEASLAEEDMPDSTRTGVSPLEALG